ncbi:MAG: DNA mismatch repair endonuclease MutL [Clostridia bacterium]|nr:DNA mismatch repair endonuclease MutL [Clostridia bacterium]
MSKINVLSFEIANLIAAGEVVDRPSSVLKELIENSIDAGASTIVAEIKRGGVALIRVTDNGSGIEKEDLPVALQRHATSKIKDRDDLDAIMTLGFRGEALAAISSVSEMTIISKTKDAPMATMLTAVGGRVVDISEVGASDGTTVVVENLFGNVPARRKFLKKDATEAMNVAALVERVAVSHPEISIQLLIDGEERFKTPGDSDLYNAIYAVFGRDFAKKMIKADGTANGVRVHGYVGRSDNVRKNRNLENFFINGRYVKSMTAMAAIEKAYTSFIAPECFPSCVLFLEINPSLVDVNVHPAKLEVKFTDEKAVFEAVYYTVKRALEDSEDRPELSLGTKRTTDRNALGAFVPVGDDLKYEQTRLSATAPTISTPKPPTAHAEPRVGAPRAEYTSEYQGIYDRPAEVASPTKISAPREVSGTVMTPRSSIELLERYRDSKPKQTDEEAVSAVETPAVPLPEYKLVGEVFDCYIIIEYDGAMLLIDKHAAHERIIFEELNAARKEKNTVATQALMLPITVLTSPEEYAAAEEYASDVKSVGFEYNLNGRSIDLVAVPGAIEIADAEALFSRILTELADGRGRPEITEDIRREKALYQIACKAAIKGGRMYNSTVVRWIVERVLALPDITVCPHGRPIAYKLTKNELDRQFERIK